VSLAKMAEPIEMPFGMMMTPVGPRNQIRCRSPMESGNFERGGLSIVSMDSLQ